MKDSAVRFECLKLADKILFEDYISRQLKLELMLKLYPASVNIYIENSPEPPTAEDIINEAQLFYNFVYNESDKILNKETESGNTDRNSA